MIRVAVLGAGGCAREVAWTIREADGHFRFCGYIVTDLDRLGPNDAAKEVKGDFRWLAANAGSVDGLAAGIGTPATRKTVVEAARAAFPQTTWPVIVHPSVRYDHDSASIAEGVVVCANVVMTVNIGIDRCSMIHYGCTIGHESKIGAYSVVNPGANIAGGVTIGSAVMIGSGAVVLQYRHIGDGAVIGGGAVVTKDVPPGETWAGVPARKMERQS